MAGAVGRVTVGATSVRLDTALNVSAYQAKEDGAFRIARSLVATNRGALSIFVGFANTVTTGTGYEVLAGESVSIDLAPSDQVWAISAGSVAVHTMQNAV